MGFIVPLAAIDTQFVVNGGSSPSVISSDGDMSPSCNERKRYLAIQMLRGYAALHPEPIDKATLLSDAQAVLGEGFDSFELERFVANVTATYAQLRSKICDQDPIFKSAVSPDIKFDVPQDIKFAIPQDSKFDIPQDNKFVDRHIKAMKAATDDFDCIHREFDLSSVNYNAEDAIEVLKKCRLVVLRNAFDKESIETYRKDIGDYLGGLHSGRVSSRGRTTHGEGGFYLERSPNRWEILLPRSHVSKETIAHDSTMEILRDRRILSERMIVHSTGAVIAESGAVTGQWHYDDNYIFEDSNDSGIAGHDGPIYAVTMMTPMLNLTFDHGPTEFCMGTSHLTGLLQTPVVSDASLISIDSPYETMIRFLQSHQACPPQAWRAPTLGMGDMVLFDYQIIHRGGANISPDLRTMLYTTYSRSWFRDSNFDSSMFQGTPRESNGETLSLQLKNSMFDELTASTRFAIPDQMKACQGIECIPLEQIKHFMINDKSTNRDNSTSNMQDFASFTISNMDFNVDGLLAIYVDGFFEVVLSVGQSYHATDVRVGSTLDIRDLGSGVVYKEWIVCHEQGQIVVSQLTLLTTG